MPRQLKPLEVEDVEYKSMKFKLCFDRNRNDFFVRFDAQTEVRAPSVQEVKQKFRERAETYSFFDWKPYIEVAFSEDKGRYWNDGGTEDHPVILHFVYRRFEYAVRDGKVYRRRHQLDWSDAWKDDPEVWVKIRDAYMTTEEFEHPKDMTRVPYTDARWAELETIWDGLLQVQARLKSVFNGGDFQAISRLAGQTQNLLPDGDGGQGPA